MKSEFVNKEEIIKGDTIFLFEKETTISEKCIKDSLFFGRTLHGYNFRDKDGKQQKVERLLFPKYFKGKVVGHFSQI